MIIGKKIIRLDLIDLQLKIKYIMSIVGRFDIDIGLRALPCFKRCSRKCEFSFKLLTDTTIPLDFTAPNIIDPAVYL